MLENVFEKVILPQIINIIIIGHGGLLLWYGGVPEGGTLPADSLLHAASLLYWKNFSDLLNIF